MSFRARLTGEQASKFAALRAISADLEDVVAFCRRLRELTRDRDANDAPRDDVAFQAFWIAALVTYARCFEPARRGLALMPEDVIGVGLNSDWHETFMGLRDEHFAHAVDKSLEEFVVDAVLSGVVRGAQNVEEILVSGHKRTAASTQYIEQLMKMAIALRKAVDARMEIVRNALLVQTRGRPLDELYASPSTPQVLPPRTGPRARIGSRRRKR